MFPKSSPGFRNLSSVIAPAPMRRGPSRKVRLAPRKDSAMTRATTTIPFHDLTFIDDMAYRARPSGLKTRVRWQGTRRTRLRRQQCPLKGHPIERRSEGPRPSTLTMRCPVSRMFRNLKPKSRSEVWRAEGRASRSRPGLTAARIDHRLPDEGR